MTTIDGFIGERESPQPGRYVRLQRRSRPLYHNTPSTDEVTIRDSRAKLSRRYTAPCC